MICSRFKHPVAALAVSLSLALPGWAQQASDLDDLFSALAEADAAAAAKIEEKIWAEWSKSGSDAMDLLLERGREALDNGDTKAAIGHFSALIDHAPDFAEAYNARASAYFQAGMFGPSLSDIRQVLAKNPRHFGAMTGLGLILEDLGRDTEALDIFREVEAIHPMQDGLAERIERLERALEGERI